MLEGEEPELSLKREGWMSLWKNRQKKWSRRGAFSTSQKALQRNRERFYCFYCCLFFQWWWWVALESHCFRVWFNAELGLLSMCLSFKSLPCVHMGFLWILFPPNSQKHAARITGYAQSPWVVKMCARCPVMAWHPLQGVFTPHAWCLKLHKFANVIFATMCRPSFSNTDINTVCHKKHI